MNDLPPALAPVAEVLTLAQGFALCVVTGPRDHCDSVYLRLVRSLARDFLLVRHRLDAADALDFHDVLSSGGDERTRAVFVTGLERMSHDARQETTVRLNLVRDSWAPHPARVIVWLPSWGLGEFRRLAPDLFHWRSSLTILHDADVPVRDEIEYLVWACEYLIGASRRERWSDAFPSILRLLHDAHGDRVPPLHWASGEQRGVLVGFEPAERSRLLHDLCLYAATHRLHDRTCTQRRFAPRDLDILARTGRVHFGEEDPGPGYAPLLVRAVDAAGRLDPEHGWASLAHVVGIPGADSVVPVLTALAASGELCIFLDGFDLLDLRPTAAAGRWLAWLESEHPRLRILASAAADVPLAFAGWNIIRKKHTRPRSVEGDAHAELVDLLARLFSTAELAAWFRYWFDDESAAGPPADASAREAAIHLLHAVSSYGLLDAAFFEELKRLRPRQLRSIEAIEQAFREA